MQVIQVIWRGNLRNKKTIKDKEVGLILNEKWDLRVILSCGPSVTLVATSWIEASVRTVRGLPDQRYLQYIIYHTPA